MYIIIEEGIFFKIFLKNECKCIGCAMLQKITGISVDKLAKLYKLLLINFYRNTFIDLPKLIIDYLVVNY